MAIVGVFLAFAVAAPVKIIRVQSDEPAAATSAAASTPGKATGSPNTAEVKMAGLEFAPKTVTIRKGGTVNFDNNDVAPHTVTQTGSGGVDSGTLNPGQSFDLTADKPLDYFCQIHPSMKASIRLAG